MAEHLERARAFLVEATLSGDADECKRLVLAAAAGGDPVGEVVSRLFAYGNSYDARLAVRRLQQILDESNDAAAAYYLGYCYRSGKGGARKSKKKAFQMYSRAADAGFVAAFWRLAACYEHGIGTKADREKALQLYTRGADGGHHWARYELTVYAHLNSPRGAVPREASESRAVEELMRTARGGSTVRTVISRSSGSTGSGGAEVEDGTRVEDFVEDEMERMDELDAPEPVTELDDVDELLRELDELAVEEA